jgi:hypothetical protein
MSITLAKLLSIKANFQKFGSGYDILLAKFFLTPNEAADCYVEDLLFDCLINDKLTNN